MRQPSFYDTDIKEQETIINVDYEKKIATFYTSRKTIYSRMKKEIGEPTRVYYIGKKITGATWEISFKDKRINKIFYKSKIIGEL